MTTDKELKLLPCPMCNGLKLHTFQQIVFERDTQIDREIVTCKSCRCEAPIMVWQNRATPPTDGLRSAEEFPSGAIHNGMAFMERLEAFHDDSEHKLAEEYDWQQIKLCFNYLAEYVQEQQNALASQPEKLWEALYPKGIKHPQPAEWGCMIKAVAALREKTDAQYAILLEQDEKLRVMEGALKKILSIEYHGDDTDLVLVNKLLMSIRDVAKTALADKE